MKISVDGGALYQNNNQRFGTSIFSENLIKALQLYDKKNIYKIYTFKNLKPKLLWMKGRISLEEFKDKQDIFLALNQALPLYTSGKIINFCHGLSYYFYPQYYPKKDVIRLNKQLKEMINRSDYVIVSSEKVKKELTIINYSVKDKTFVIPFGIPFDMNNDSGQARMTSFWGSASWRRLQNPYFLFVGMNHPIKNIDFIREAFEKFEGSKGFKKYKLLLVTKNISRKKLKKLYQNATALLTASHYESFNFPVLEALSLGCPVIGLKSAIIPELESFVNVVSNKEEFVLQMKKITIKPTVQSINRLYINFNWKNYVSTLISLLVRLTRK